LNGIKVFIFFLSFKFLEELNLKMSIQAYISGGGRAAAYYLKDFGVWKLKCFFWGGEGYYII